MSEMESGPEPDRDQQGGHGESAAREPGPDPTATKHLAGEKHARRNQENEPPG